MHDDIRVESRAAKVQHHRRGARPAFERLAFCYCEAMLRSAPSVGRAV
jgi:hypothetical protein